jgi:hypothetical protein
MTKLKFENKSIFTEINKLKDLNSKIEQLETEKDKFYLEIFLESDLYKKLDKIPKPNQDKSSLKDKIH